MQIENNVQHTLDSVLTLCNAKNYIQAKTVLEPLLQLEPALLSPDTTQSYLFHLNGWIYSHLGMSDEAIKNYTRSLETSSSQAYTYQTYEYRATLKREIEPCDYWDIIKDYSASLELNSDYTRAYAGRAYCYNKTRQFEEAIQDYTKAISLDEEPNFLYHYCRANAFYHLGKYVEAESDYAFVANFCPSEYKSDFYLIWADSQWRLNEFEKSLSTMNHVKTWDKSQSLKFFQLSAYNHYHLGHYLTAFAELEQAILLDPKDPNLTLQRAWVLFELERFNEALRDAKSFLMLYPNDEMAITVQNKATQHLLLKQDNI